MTPLTQQEFDEAIIQLECCTANCDNLLGMLSDISPIKPFVKIVQLQAQNAFNILKDKVVQHG